MISLPTVLYLSTVISGVVWAKPALTRRQTTPQTCTPKFSPDDPFDWNNSENIGLSDGVKEGSGLIKTQPLGLFKFTKNNASLPSFTVHSFENQNLGVGIRSNTSLFLTQKTGDITRFVIECGDCGNSVNDNCFMKLADRPDLCVQVGKNAPSRGSDGDPLFVTSPCRKDDSQRFNYFKRPAPNNPPVQPPTNSNPPDSTPSNICNPNFEFEGVRVANSAVYWGASSFIANTDLTANGDFNKRLEIRFEQTGSPNPYYVAKSLNGTNLGVAVRPNGNLYFVDKLDTNNARHKWSIECKSGCKGGSQTAPGDLLADGCTIKSNFDNKCVQIGKGPSAGVQGDRIFVNTCDGTDSQRLNFITSPFKASGRVGSEAKSGGSLAVVAGDSSEVNLDVKQLITNSYIVIGLLAGILIAMVFLVVMSSRGCLKGRESKSRYTYVAGKDMESLTTTSGRYSD